MPGGTPLRLGPFLGGLNTASDPTAIGDAELAECTNFELDIDGSLASRPPLKELAGHVSWTERIVLLTEGIFSGNHYVIGTNTDGVFYYFGGAWTLITNTFEAGAAAQYAGKIYLIPRPGSANPGGKWDPSGGFTAVAAIPQGQGAVIHKERMFITPGITATSNESRLRFSDAGNLDVWDAANFIDAGQGDGTNLVDLTVFQDNIILFKEQSTYVLAYDIRPTDAVLRKISLTIGVSGQRNVANYENQVYIFHGGWIYEIINYDFNRLNTKVPFIRDDTAPSSFDEEVIFLSILEDRLICRYYRNIYAFNIRTRTWSQWESVANVLHYFGPIVTIHPPTGNEYYAGSCLTANETVIKLYNKAAATTAESPIAGDQLITCVAKTKNFDMAISHQFKRLWWWGTDVVTNNSIVGIATPITFSFNVTWGALNNAGKQWNQVQTWGQPLTVPSSVITTVATGTGTARRFAKFLKALRYRQINFQVELTTEGSTVDGPARLFTMTIVTESKQVVPKSVN